MIEKDVYKFKTKIKVGIMYAIYVMNGKINDIDFSLLDDETLDAYLEGSFICAVDKLRKESYEKWCIGLMYEDKEFRGYIINKDKDKLKEQLVCAMIDYRYPKYSIIENL